MLELTNHAERRSRRLPAAGNSQARFQRRRVDERHAVMLPVLLTWKDRGGVTHCAHAVTRNVSKQGVYVECSLAVSIPLYRLVLLRIVRHVRHFDGLPESLRQDAILSAVYRVTLPKTPNEPSGLALRLMA